MATMRIYLPDALKAELDQFEGINWSAAAQEAFRAAIDIEKRKEISMEMASLERLRNSRRADHARRTADGIAMGKKWALERAEYDQLQRVAALTDDDWSVWMLDFGEENRAIAASTLASAVAGEQTALSGTKELMESLLGIDSPTLSEVDGFLTGAAEVFEQI